MKAVRGYLLLGALLVILVCRVGAVLASLYR